MEVCKTGIIDPNGLHDCTKHATHCVIIGYEHDKTPIVIPASPEAEHAIQWHDIFDMKNKIKKI